MTFALRQVGQDSGKTGTRDLPECVGGVRNNQLAHFNPVLPMGWLPFDLYYMTFLDLPFLALI